MLKCDFVYFYITLDLSALASVSSGDSRSRHGLAVSGPQLPSLSQGLMGRGQGFSVEGDETLCH